MADLARLKESLQAMQAELAQRQGTRSKLELALESAETEMAEVHKKIASTSAQIADRERRLEALVGEHQRLNRQLADQRQVFEQQLRTAYLINREPRLKMLLDQDNPQRLARRLAYYDYLARDSRGRIDAYFSDLAHLAALRVQLDAETATLQGSRDQLAMREQALGSLQASRRETLVKLDAEIGSSRVRIEEMDRERQELETLLDSMSRALAGLELDSDILSFNAARGRMPWPVEGRLRNHFGGKRAQGGLRWHGLLIGASEGKDVQAIHHGRVVYADWLRGSGLLIILDHGDGYMSLYAHNQSLLRETGEWVRTSDVLARVGTTGGRQQPGLYFEIRHRGAPLDPISWCLRRT